jgi:hypothetical protein
VSVPTGNKEVVSDALPALSDPVPKTAEPFLNVMISKLGRAPVAELTGEVYVRFSLRTHFAAEPRRPKGPWRNSYLSQ